MQQLGTQELEQLKAQIKCDMDIPKPKDLEHSQAKAVIKYGKDHLRLAHVRRATVNVTTSRPSFQQSKQVSSIGMEDHFFDKAMEHGYRYKQLVVNQALP